MGKYFPLSVTGQKSTAHLVVVICAYLVIGYIIGPIVSTLVGWLPLIGGILRFLVWLVRIYCFLGIVVAFLFKFKVIDK